jgi:hypothetical protein
VILTTWAVGGSVAFSWGFLIREYPSYGIDRGDSGAALMTKVSMRSCGILSVRSVILGNNANLWPLRPECLSGLVVYFGRCDAFKIHGSIGDRPLISLDLLALTGCYLFVRNSTRFLSIDRWHSNFANFLAKSGHSESVRVKFGYCRPYYYSVFLWL